MMCFSTCFETCWPRSPPRVSQQSEKPTAHCTNGCQ